MAFAHIPVMAREVLELLKLEPSKRYLDGTLGGGGHTEQILLASSPNGQVLGLDRDWEALEAAAVRLSGYRERVILRHANYADARRILAELSWGRVDGAILDLGVSSYQLDSPERGFSFQSLARLDMRMDRTQALDAHAIVNTFPASEIERILREYGEEPQARRIANAIVAERKVRRVETTVDLAAIVARVKRRRGHAPHPATQTFQAFRIAVNKELENLKAFLSDGYELLQPRARMVIIAFHSLEDRLVKNAFRQWDRSCLCPPRTPVCQCGWSRKVKLLTRKPMVPTANELAANPRSRSAKLRAVERV